MLKMYKKNEKKNLFLSQTVLLTTFLFFFFTFVTLLYIL